MNISSIKTAAEALGAIETLKAFIENSKKMEEAAIALSNKITKIVPFELYEFDGEYRMITPSEFPNKFFLCGLGGSVNNCFSDDPRSLDEWLERATKRGWTKSIYKMDTIPSIPTTRRSAPEFTLNNTTIKSVSVANGLIAELTEYVAKFDKVVNTFTLEDIKPYEIFSYESNITSKQSRMLVPVYNDGIGGGNNNKFILTGQFGDIKAPFPGIGRKTKQQWLEFVIQHGWRKTDTKFGIVKK